MIQGNIAMKFEKYNLFIKIRKSTFFLCLAVALATGYMTNTLVHVNSDGRKVKFPIWSPIATEKYKDYDFTHVDYLQPQYVNIIVDSEMLAMVKADISKGTIQLMNSDYPVEIGDFVKLTADNHRWFLISKQDKFYKFENVEKGE